MAPNFFTDLLNDVFIPIALVCIVAACVPDASCVVIRLGLDLGRWNRDAVRSHISILPSSNHRFAVPCRYRGHRSLGRPGAGDNTQRPGGRAGGQPWEGGYSSGPRWIGMTSMSSLRTRGGARSSGGEWRGGRNSLADHISIFKKPRLRANPCPPHHPVRGKPGRSNRFPSSEAVASFGCAASWPTLASADSSTAVG